MPSFPITIRPAGEDFEVSFPVPDEAFMVPELRRGAAAIYPSTFVLFDENPEA